MPVQTPFDDGREQFIDSNGNPIVDGRLYIGKPNTDPVNPANRLDVYPSRGNAIAGTLPLSQPISTNASGYPESPVWTTQTYSYVLENSAGAQVLTEPYIEVLDVEQLVNAAIASQLAALDFDIKNLAVNGGMAVTTSASSVPTIGTSFVEGHVARTFVRASAISAGEAKQANVGFGKSLFAASYEGLTVPGASDWIEHEERIPAGDAQRLVSRATSTQFLINHDFGSSTGFTITIAKPNVKDDFSAVTVIDTSAVLQVPDNNPTKITFSIADAGDVSKGLVVTLRANCGQLTSGLLQVTDFQVEQSDTAGAFVTSEYLETRAAVKYDDDRKLSEILFAQELDYRVDIIHGCRMSANSIDPVNDIDIGAGYADKAGQERINHTSTLVKQIDVLWAAGSDAGGRPSAVFLSSEKYLYFFLIRNSSGVVDAGFDDNSLATNLLFESGYLTAVHIGSVFWDGSSITRVINNNEIGHVNFRDVFTSSGNFHVPPGVLFGDLFIQGGGGEGSNGNFDGNTGGQSSFDAVSAQGGDGGDSGGMTQPTVSAPGQYQFQYTTVKTLDHLSYGKGGAGDDFFSDPGFDGYDGGFIYLRDYSLTPGASYPVVIGAGGAGGGGGDDGSPGFIVVEY